MRQLMSGLTLALLYSAYLSHERGAPIYAWGFVFAAGVAWSLTNKESPEP